ncbi:nitrile hydratase accessory protein [uncultured Roseobacter sp.]|uniref:nitrile hydratase accessory protein n=1 Tax=uncultured Roseobacter sp. TaxID=114847 RepID=UPI002637BE3B|nr:nitrile hydratase accessory protein [uncultured Roseobacter sp.]
MNDQIKGSDLKRTPNLPHDAGGPVFNAPWEAKAFAMTVDLHKRGVFDWSEWCDTLADEIKSAQAAGDPDLGDTYYKHWLKALETLITAKNVSTAERLLAAKEDWRAADQHRGLGEAPVFVKGAAQPGA